MANYNQYQQVPFWDFVRGFEGQHNGEGVDHHPTFPQFGYLGQEVPLHHGPHFGWGEPRADGPWRAGRGGRGGGNCRRSRGPPGEEPEGHNRSRTASPTGEQTEGEGANTSGNEGRGGRGGFGRRGGHHYGRGHHAHGHAHGRHGPGGRGPWGRRGPPPPFGGPGPFNLSGLYAALNAHPGIGGSPWAQMFRQFAEQAGVVPEPQESGETVVEDEAENSFIPPVDIFSTEAAYILHVAIPGAKKEDVGVNWDSDKGELNIAGVVYRKGDEEFLKTLSQSERKVGVFERSVKLPPGDEEKEEVDSDGINAKLEDGVLIVTVPKVEKEWTEVKRVDIQ